MSVTWNQGEEKKQDVFSSVSAVLWPVQKSGTSKFLSLAQEIKSVLFSSFSIEIPTRKTCTVELWVFLGFFRCLDGTRRSLIVCCFWSVTTSGLTFLFPRCLCVKQFYLCISVISRLLVMQSRLCLSRCPLCSRSKYQPDCGSITVLRLVWTVQSK